jgi:hypothetical protein
MKAKVVVFLAALAGAVVVVAGSPASRSAACAPSAVDVICRLTATVKLTSGGVTTTVVDYIGHVIAPLTRVDTSIYGSGRVYFKRTAICQLMRPTAAGTRIYTRTPAGFLYTQTKGWTTCTFSDGTKSHISGSGKQPAFAQVTRFFADLTASTGGQGFTQFRAIYVPGSSLKVAVYKGRLVVKLSDGRTFEVLPGQELVVTLTPTGQIRSAKVGPGTFSTREKRVFASEGKQLG